MEKVVAWTYGQVDLAKVHMPLPGQFRARLALEVYMIWQQNKSTNIRQIVKNIAARDYAVLMTNAEMGNQEAKAMVEALGLKRNPQTGVVSPRSEVNIQNDIYVVNQLCGRLSTAKNHIQRAMYEDNIEWLIGFARKTGNVTAMREAQRNLEKINNDFKDEQNPADALKPGAERNVTNDISIIKPDRKNIDSEEMRKFAKQIGAKWEDVQEYYEDQNGDMVPVHDEEEQSEQSQSWGQAPGSDDQQEPDTKTAEPTDEPDTYDPFG